MEADVPRPFLGYLSKHHLKWPTKYLFWSRCSHFLSNTHSLIHSHIHTHTHIHSYTLTMHTHAHTHTHSLLYPHIHTHSKQMLKIKKDICSPKCGQGTLYLWDKMYVPYIYVTLMHIPFSLHTHLRDEMTCTVRNLNKSKKQWPSF